MRMKAKCLMLMRGYVALLLMPCSGFALDPAKSVFQYSCLNWTRANGLPGNAVNAITQAKDGYLWLGTQNGLVRFDGIRFELVEVPDSLNVRSTRIQCLAPRTEGGVWFGSEESAYGSYDGYGRWQLGMNAEGRTDWDVYSLLMTHEGRLFVVGSGTSGWRTNNTSIDSVFRDVPEDTPYDVTATFEDSLGRIWLGTADRGLFYWQDGTLTKFPDASLDAEMFFAITEDHDGDIWLGTSKGLIRLDPQFQRKEVVFPQNQVSALLVDRQGSLWIGTADSGVARWRNGEFTMFRQSDGLVSDAVRSLAEDREGSLWIGTGEGLSQLMDVKFPTYTEKEGMFGNLKLSVNGSPRGGLWAATDDGLTYFNGWGTQYSTETGLRDAYVKRVFEAANGDLFVISGRNEIEVLADGKVVARHETTAMPVAFTEDARGVVVSVAGDLHRIGRDYFHPYAFADGESPPLYWVLNLMTAHDGAIWVASANGICRVKDGHAQQWTQQEGLSDLKARWVCEDQEGVIWIGTPSSIARLKDGTIRNIRSEDGLLGSSIYAMVPDDYGHLWVDSTRGLYRASLESLNDVADGRADRVECVGYDSLDAVKSMDRQGQEQSGCKTLDGRIWFPSQNGVIGIDPGNVPVNRVVPSVHVERICADRTELLLSKHTVLPPGNRELEFKYTATTFISPEKARFRYQLEGYDPAWVDAGDRRVAFYTNLKPGRYTFRVKACNADGVWNTAGDSISIELTPYFYETAWFKGASALLAVMTLGGVTGLRVNHLKRRQHRLEHENEHLESKVRGRTLELAEQRNLLRTLIDHLPDNVFVKDTQSRVMIDNAAHAQALGASGPEEMIGRTDFDCLPNELAEKFCADEQQLMRSGKPYEGEESIVHAATGQTCWMWTTKVPLKDSAGEIIGLAGINRDITEQRALKEQLLQAQKMESVGQLAGGVAHDFNNLMMVILGYAEMLLNRQQLSPDAADPLRHIQTAATRAGDLTRQLLAFSRKQVMRVEDLNVNELTNNLTKLLGRTLGEHIKVRSCTSSVAGYVTADPGMIEQAIMNLTVNARDAMPNGGSLRIETSLKHIDEAYLRHQPDARPGPFACISVTDDGCGIPPDHLPRLFEPFFTTKDVSKGTGLGLATVYGIIRQHSGWIEVDSKVGKGTTFRMFLPASERVEASASATSVVPLVRGGNETILVVEDEPALRELISTSLEIHGYQVHVASSGAEALATWGNRLQVIDLVVTDVVMPDGVSGWKLAQEFSSIKPGLRIICMSGYDESMTDQMPVLASTMEFLHKPFSPTKLAEMVRTHLDDAS